jgi:hypothetical protein
MIIYVVLAPLFFLTIRKRVRGFKKKDHFKLELLLSFLTIITICIVISAIEAVRR